MNKEKSIRMSVLEIKNDLLRLVVETDDAVLLDTVRNYFKELKKAPTDRKTKKTTQNKKKETLKSKETSIIKKIKSTYPAKLSKRYKALRAMVESDQMTASERKELVKLTNQFEELDAKKMKFLLELAQLRDQPLNFVLKEFSSTSGYA